MAEYNARELTQFHFNLIEISACLDGNNPCNKEPLKNIHRVKKIENNFFINK